jgi:hypothetical protein
MLHILRAKNRNANTLKIKILQYNGFGEVLSAFFTFRQVKRIKITCIEGLKWSYQSQRDGEYCSGGF